MVNIVSELVEIDNADTGTDWNNGSQDTDTFIQGSASVGAKVSQARTHISYAPTPGEDISAPGLHLYIWANCSSAGLMSDKATGGMRIRITDASTSNYWEWLGEGSDTYSGGWIPMVADIRNTDRDWETVSPDVEM